MKLSEYERSRSFFDLGQRSLRFHIKALGGIGMKIYTNELGHMTNMAAMPIYGKNLKKSPTPEPIDRWP